MNTTMTRIGVIAGLLVLMAGMMVTPASARRWHHHHHRHHSHASIKIRL
jgi:hypothetical protein